MKKNNNKEIRNKKNKALIKKLIKNIGKDNKRYKNKSKMDIVGECSSIIMKCRNKSTFKMNKVRRMQKMMYLKVKSLYGWTK